MRGRDMVARVYRLCVVVALLCVAGHARRTYGWGWVGSKFVVLRLTCMRGTYGGGRWGGKCVSGVYGR